MWHLALMVLLPLQADEEPPSGGQVPFATAYSSLGPAMRGEDPPSIPLLPPSAVVAPVWLSPEAAPERHRQAAWWVAVTFGQHAAATFDAWATLRGLADARLEEKNPFLNPFSHSNVLYAAIHVVPLGMDALGWFLMTSSNSSLRRFWWVPQILSTGLYVASGLGNLAIQR